MLTPVEVELFYYHLNNAVLLGNSNSAKLYLDMLRADYDEQSFKILNDGRLEHLQQLAAAVDAGLTVKNFDFKDDSSEVEKTERDEHQVEDELSLVKLICSDITPLRFILNASDSLRISNVEQPTQYGRVDIVLQDGDTVYLVETKKGDARYAVISQIDKYTLHYNLRLVFKLWKKVVGVVIANAFIGRVSQELVKIGVVPIKYQVKNGVLRFRRLHAKAQETDSNT
jgi:RecB family endonuclease NucS